jgi:hypothetical protein
LRKRFEKQIADLTEQIEMNAFAPRMKPEEAPLSKGVEALRFRRDKLRAEVQRKTQELKPKGIFGTVGEGFNAARAVMTSFDFSAVLRQGGFIALAHPVRAAKSLGPMFRAFASEQSAHRINAEIADRPNAPLYARSKLHLSELGGALNAKEEAFMSRWVERIPFVKGSARAYTTFLNKLRADSFDAMASTLGKGGEVTGEEASALANFINVPRGEEGWGSWSRSRNSSTRSFSPRGM